MTTHEFLQKGPDNRRGVALLSVARKSNGAEPGSADLLKQRMGNQGVHRMMNGLVGGFDDTKRSGAAVVQAKLTVSQPGDAHEREADRVADDVMRMAQPDMRHTPAVSSSNAILTAQPKCVHCDEEDRKKGNAPVSRKGQTGDAPVDRNTAASIGGLSGGGSRLPAATRAFFEPRFGADFSDVRVHTDTRAQEAAASIDARAFTVGSDIAFAKGEYSPHSSDGQRLLAHELTHTLQQGAAEVDRSIVLRQPKAPNPVKGTGDEAKNEGNPTPTGGPMQQVYVVRDKGLQLGGTLVSDLASFKRNVMGTRIANDWTLVLSIHGSQERLGAQSPPDWQKNAIFYQASDIETLFNGDKAFVKWRDQFGPAHLSLVSCQVSASFEGTLISNLTRTGLGNKGSTNRGLGAGCKPIASTISFGDAPSTRAKFDKLPKTKQDSLLEKMNELNRTWGYFGAPPVPADQVLHFYYDEEPKGEWVMVEVRVGTGHTLDELKRTGIPYWNRGTGSKAAEFRRLCDQGVGQLKPERKREHVPTVPGESEE